MPPGALTPTALTRSRYGSTSEISAATVSSAVVKPVGRLPRSRMEKSSPSTAHLTAVPPTSIPKNSCMFTPYKRSPGRASPRPSQGLPPCDGRAASHARSRLSLFYASNLVRRSIIYCLLGRSMRNLPSKVPGSSSSVMPHMSTTLTLYRAPDSPSNSRDHSFKYVPNERGGMAPLGSLKPSCRNHSVAA